VNFGQGTTSTDHRRSQTPQQIKFFAGLVPLALLFIVGGVLHFWFPKTYLRIMPAFLPWPGMLVGVSGAAEIVGGLGLLIARFRRAAAYCLAFLLVAIFPANIFMAATHVSFPGIMGESWVQWLRLPLQIPLILWALHYRHGTKQEI
jgi:uncharacterized membrane protein